MTPSEPVTVATVISCLAALVTAATAGMTKIIRELRKISNGKMERIGEHLEHLVKLERANLRAAGRTTKAIETLRSDLSAALGASRPGGDKMEAANGGEKQ